MAIVIVEAVSPMSSWRPPEALTYHRSLPLPPYTTQVGMLGACMGFSLQDAFQFVADHQLRLGVGGWHRGKARDLWKFQKLKDNNEVTSDVLLREMWVESRLIFVLEIPEAEIAEQVAGGFRTPKYPLTAGPSDALLHAQNVQIREAIPQSERRIHHTLVYREITPHYHPFEHIKDVPISRTVQGPSVENLPTGFHFDGDGLRRLAGRAVMSYVGDAIEIDPDEESVMGYQVEPRSKPFQEVWNQWKDQELPWTIPVHRYD